MKRSGSQIASAVMAAVGVILALVPGSPAAAADPKVLARVDGEPITMVDLDGVLAGMESVRGAPGSMDVTPQAVLTRLIQNRLLEQEGYRIGADRKPEVQGQLQDFVQHKCMMALLDSVSAGVPELTDEELDEFLGPPGTMNRISHLLVPDPLTAQALLDSLADGASFAALAKRYSADTTFAGEGGDLGWSGKGTLIPAFEGAIEGLAVGQVGGPVQTEKGWHLIQLTDTRTERLGKSDKMRVAVHDAEMKNRVMTRVRAYIASLKQKHGVVVDEDLLQSLDYGSKDQAVQEELRESKAVLATLGKRPFTVGGLSFKIRFENFHGIEGKSDADQIRDKVFDEWLTESLLRYEALQEGYQHKPDIAAAAESYERDLLRETVLSLVLEIPYEPDAEDMADYYASHLEEFTPKPRVKADGVFLGDRVAALEFKQKLEAGTSMGWLAERTAAVTDPKPDVFADWLGPEVLGGLGLDLEKGMIVGPFVLRESWAVARIVDMDTVKPTPLAQCQEEVAASMKNARMRESVHRALEQLEAQADVRVEPDAEKLIAGRIDEWLAN